MAKGDYQATLDLLSTRPVIYAVIQREVSRHETWLDLARSVMANEDDIALRDLILKSSRWVFSQRANKACSRRVPRRGEKVVKSKSKVSVGRTRG